MIAEGPNAYYRLRYHLYLIIPTFFREDLNIRNPSESAHVFKKNYATNVFCLTYLYHLLMPFQPLWQKIY